MTRHRAPTVSSLGGGGSVWDERGLERGLQLRATAAAAARREERGANLRRGARAGAGELAERGDGGANLGSGAEAQDFCGPRGTQVNTRTDPRRSTTIGGRGGATRTAGLNLKSRDAYRHTS